MKWFGMALDTWAFVIAAGCPINLAGQYMIATDMITPLHTLVDYYTHIKGIEYLICVAFFVAFPVFYTYTNTETKMAEVKL
jgi:hypothetical protein